MSWARHRADKECVNYTHRGVQGTPAAPALFWPKGSLSWPELSLLMTGMDDMRTFTERVLLLNRVNVLQGFASLSTVYLLSLDFKTHLELSLHILLSFILLKPHIWILTYNFFAFIGLP